MALIPNLGSARFDSNGELRLAERLKDFLEENAWIWHNLPMRFLTMHNAKGLEFPCVAIGGLGALGGRPGKPIEDDIRLAYVAVTRAMHEAFLTYSRASPLVERLVA